MHEMRRLLSRTLRRRPICLFALAALGLFFIAPLFAQAPPVPSPTPQPSAPQPPAAQGSPPQGSASTETLYKATPDAEVTTRDSQTTFKVRVNLVLVRVVVRDQSGKIVDNLKKEDFLLYDNRKPQSISTFSLETPASQAVPVVSVSDHTVADGEEKTPAPNLPQRFVTLLFDDVNISQQDSLTVRNAASKILDSISPYDRIGIATTSGQVFQDFTSDRAALQSTLMKIIPRPLVGDDSHNCPDISYYQADLIVNKSDSQALSVAVQDTMACGFTSSQQAAAAAASIAQATARQVLSVGDASVDYTYRHMEDALRHLTAMPGQRKMVFLSPGFIITTLLQDRSDIIDRANRSGIVIDTLDARGLYTPDTFGDISAPSSINAASSAGFKTNYRLAAQFEQAGILEDLAYGTGGNYFHNRNDLDVALREAVAAPAASYLLGFSPQNLKLNGSFHTLKVALAGKQKYKLQVRRGYFAPRTMKNPEEEAKAEIQEAVFSQEEIHDLPVDLQTQFFRTDSTQARLSVLAHLDLKGFKFRKVDGRNHDNLTLAAVVFDQNGNFVTGGEKIVEMKLLDSTLERLGRSGITVKSSFDVKPGTYLVRLVVRDKQGDLMAARNGAVVIPY